MYIGLFSLSKTTSPNVLTFRIVPSGLLIRKSKTPDCSPVALAANKSWIDCRSSRCINPKTDAKLGVNVSGETPWRRYNSSDHCMAPDSSEKSPHQWPCDSYWQTRHSCPMPGLDKKEIPPLSVDNKTGPARSDTHSLKVNRMRRIPQMLDTAPPTNKTTSILQKKHF